MATKEFNISGNGVQYMNDVAEASDSSAKSFKSAKAELRALQNQMLEMDQSSEEFKKASKRASELKDNINDLSQELSANAGNAFEQVSNNIGLFGDRIMSLDFKGAGNALTGFGNALGSLDFKTIKEEIGGLIKGFANMGKALLANPIFLIGALIAGIIMNWDSLVKLWNSSSLDALEKQLNNIKAQKAQLEDMLAIEKARGKSAGETLAMEFETLRLRKEQANKERQIADLNTDSEARMKAQEESAKAIQEQRLLTAQTEAKINEAYRNALAFFDSNVKAQQDKENSVKNETDAINQANVLINEQSKKQSELNAKIALYEKVANSNLSISERANLLAQDGVISAEEASYQQGLANQSARNKEKIEAKLLNIANEKLGFLRYELQQSNGILSNTKNQLDLIIKAKDEKLKTFKTDKQIADEQKAIDDANRKAEERRQKAIEAQKKLNEDIKDIEERIAEIRRDGMSAQEKELYALQLKQDAETKIYDKAKKSEKEKQELRLAHEAEYQAILDKYDREEEEKDKAKRDAEIKAQQERLHAKQLEIIELQATIDEADEANYQASLTQQQREISAIQTKYFEQITLAEKAGLDITALQIAQNRELAIVNDKYRKEEKEKDQALIDSKFEMTKAGLSALSSLVESFGTKSEKNAKRQFEINKSLSLAQAIITTYQAVNQQLAVPKDALTGENFIKAGIALATGLANVIKIQQTKFESKTTPSGGGGLNGNTNVGGTPSPLSLSFLQNQPNQQPPFQAYVISGQVSNSIEAQQLINNQSKL